MEIIHFSAECYPAAKAGGLGDVVGALPKYLNQLDCRAKVVMPAYKTDWLQHQPFDVVFKGSAPLGDETFDYEVRRVKNDSLGYKLYAIHIPGRFNREGVYIDPVSGFAYWDELERFISFQVAGLDWINSLDRLPEVIHCHDHHSGLIPFMMGQCFRYNDLAGIPTVLTIHNGEYHGEHEMSKYHLLPPFDMSNIGLLEWNRKLNSLAAGIKCAWRVSTVSQSYMRELAEESSGLEPLIAHEKDKTLGIINGIDYEVWNPGTDSYIAFNYSTENFKKGKTENKKQLCDQFDINPEWPTIGFIGRLVKEKGADLLPDLFEFFLKKNTDVNFVVLGTGEPALHKRFEALRSNYIGYFDSRLEYNEKLAHQIYAGCDYLLMPSRVEPCGLNQMYAMRYGTVPVVRATGGLQDTVIDISEPNGYGIVFENFTLEDAVEAIERSIKYYEDFHLFNKIRKKLLTLDFSWQRSARRYLELYKSITNNN